MGKKSRRNNRNNTTSTTAAAAATTTTSSSASVPQSTSSPPPSHQPTSSVASKAASAEPNASVAADAQMQYYPSDGPSDVELLQTTSTSLQQKLNQLTQLGLDNNNRVEFVQQFVPLDLSQADTNAYLQDLTTGPESEGQWTNLIAEIAAIRSGRGVDKIEGDQITRASFFFQHPLLDKCDREVTFVCINGEWRAEG